MAVSPRHWGRPARTPFIPSLRGTATIAKSSPICLGPITASQRRLVGTAALTTCHSLLSAKGLATIGLEARGKRFDEGSPSSDAGGVGIKRDKFCILAKPSLGGEPPPIFRQCYQRPQCDGYEETA